MADLSGMKILVVDDEPDLRELLTLEFESYKAEVQSAGSGTEALEKLTGSVTFDAVVTDVRMPGLDGVGLLEALRKLDPNKPAVILITGFSDITKELAIQKGAIDLFSKPIDWEALAALLESIRS